MVITIFCIKYRIRGFLNIEKCPCYLSSSFIEGFLKMTIVLARLVYICGLFLILTSCSDSDDHQKPIRLTGQTMGTSYSVTIVSNPNGINKQKLRESIEYSLAKVNSQMSNWDKNSEISLFNKNNSNKPIHISQPLFDVITAANDINLKSGGVFDITLTPLINLWGFGTKQPINQPPTDDEISLALSKVGQKDLLKLSSTEKTLSKIKQGVSINLSAIAKGYGIDQLASMLTNMKINRYLIEIGGDLIVSGLNAEGKLWKIGVETPSSTKHSVQSILTIRDKAMATSGDYRNFFEQNGVRYSHIINPNTGRPIQHKTSSVTVLAKNAMLADGWATAMLAMGAEKGMVVANRYQLAVFFISNHEDILTTSSSLKYKELTNIINKN
jgi:thiamine biosynthesis lipoprotein